MTCADSYDSHSHPRKALSLLYVFYPSSYSIVPYTRHINAVQGPGNHDQTSTRQRGAVRKDSDVWKSVIFFWFELTCANWRVTRSPRAQPRVNRVSFELSSRSMTICQYFSYISRYWVTFHRILESLDIHQTKFVITNIEFWSDHCFRRQGRKKLYTPEWQSKNRTTALILVISHAGHHSTGSGISAIIV